MAPSEGWMVWVNSQRSPVSHQTVWKSNKCFVAEIFWSKVRNRAVKVNHTLTHWRNLDRVGKPMAPKWWIGKLPAVTNSSRCSKRVVYYITCTFVYRYIHTHARTWISMDVHTQTHIVYAYKLLSSLSRDKLRLSYQFSLIDHNRPMPANMLIKWLFCFRWKWSHKVHFSFQFLPRGFVLLSHASNDTWLVQWFVLNKQHTFGRNVRNQKHRHRHGNTHAHEPFSRVQCWPNDRQICLPSDQVLQTTTRL